eukprot:jgi/Chrzof1/8255/Cz03g03100.t1
MHCHTTHCVLSCQDGPAIWDVTIRYEAPDTLILRKILDINKPEHRALLQGSTNPIVKALLDPTGVDSSNARQKKRRPRTDVPIKLEGGRQLAHDEIAVCTLLDDEDDDGDDDSAQPTWQVKKKPCIALS